MSDVETDSGSPALGFALAPGVHLAWADGRLVALDIFRDRYFRVDRARSLALAGLAQAPAAQRAFQALRTRGLTREATASAEPNPWRQALGRQKIRAGDLVEVIGACAWAAGVLQRRRFADVLRAVGHAHASETEPQRALSAARTFLVHRPFYPRDYACMFEALAMLRYFAVRRLAATWMFGVRGAPFSAHCWLEYAGVVLNDDPDAVGPYKVIMGV